MTRARNRDEVPLSTALGLLLRERMTGRPSPAETAPALALVRDWLEGATDLDALAGAMDDQKAFQMLAAKMLADLELAEPPPSPNRPMKAVTTKRARTSSSRTRAKRITTTRAKATARSRRAPRSVTPTARTASRRNRVRIRSTISTANPARMATRAASRPAPTAR